MTQHLTRATQLVLLCGLTVCLGGCVDALKSLLDMGASDPVATAPAPDVPDEPSIDWSARRSSETMDLRIAESDGPVWTIAFYALGSQSKAIKEAKKIRKKGWPSHIANLSRYGSANNKALWLVYVGPYALDDEARVRADLKTIKKKVRKKAYAVTIGPHGSRKQLNDPDGSVKHVQPKPDPPPATRSRPSSSGGGIPRDAQIAYGCCNMCGGVFSFKDGCSPNSACYGRCLFQKR